MKRLTPISQKVQGRAFKGRDANGRVFEADDQANSSVLEQRYRPSDQGGHQKYQAALMNISSQAGKKIIIAAHGNSLRGVVKHLDNMSDEDIMGLNLPTGIPFVYELDENMKPVVSMKFLGDEETVRKAIESVAAQA